MNMYIFGLYAMFSIRLTLRDLIRVYVNFLYIMTPCQYPYHTKRERNNKGSIKLYAFKFFHLITQIT